MECTTRPAHALGQAALREREPGRRRGHAVGRVQRVLRAGHAAAVAPLLAPRVAPGARAAAGGRQSCSMLLFTVKHCLSNLEFYLFY